MSTRGEDIAKDSARAAAAETRKALSRSKVTRALATAEPGHWMTVRKVAFLTDLGKGTVRARLAELCKVGRVIQLGRGTRYPSYRLKGDQ